jgi:hypothetical protein
MLVYLLMPFWQAICAPTWTTWLHGMACKREATALPVLFATGDAMRWGPLEASRLRSQIARDQGAPGRAVMVGSWEQNIRRFQNTAHAKLQESVLQKGERQEAATIKGKHNLDWAEAECSFLPVKLINLEILAQLENQKPFWAITLVHGHGNQYIIAQRKCCMSALNC